MGSLAFVRASMASITDTAEVLDPVLDVHLKGAFFVTRPVWAAMREQGYGRVVNTISAAGLLGTANKSNYGRPRQG
ncbi:SDR family NAD(P)-dependent oxidoreductase [Streptomyces sp. NBC_01235]|uniref:SDR family NAD(P)-dependent oxidoreductase n=1 Tax=Streptomyces sp. NBC_01235 TaxID=2903788 RepID=UPI002E13E888|nr:SDR family NAD(P)-dependent oxidoreductase [Streptomyces sp. NBC_01235]